MTSKPITDILPDQKSADSKTDKLPIQANLTLVFIFSLVISFIVGGASLAGIVNPTEIYPSEEFLQTFVPTDVVKLCIGLPILLSSMWLAWHGKLIGLLFWPGALLYLLYSYLICVFAMPLNGTFLLHLLLVMLSLYTLIALIASINGPAVQQKLSGNVPEKLTGSVLAGFGFAFLLLAGGVMIHAIFNQISLPTTELALQIADYLITPTWLIGGAMLWRRKTLGYVVGAGLLLQSSMLMISLLIVILLKPILTTTPFMPLDFVAIFIFGLTCFVPLALFTRGVLIAQRSMSA